MARRKRAAPADHGGGGGGGGHGGGGSGRWLVSYADFITLMFVVFLVLFSMARVDAERYGSLARSLRQSMGPTGADLPGLPTRGLEGQAMPVVQPERPGNLPDLPDWPSHLIAPSPETERAPVPPAEPPPPEAKPSPNADDPVTAPPPAPADPMEGLANALQDLPGSRSGLLSVALQERGIVMSLAVSVLFDPGQRALRPEAKVQLDAVAAQLVGVVYPIMVEGTADPGPAGAPPALPPWDLAALRAGAVVQYLVQERGLPGSQFVTIGYGSSTEGEGDANRKVTIVVMRKSNAT